MTALKLDLDDLLSDMHSLKISALSNAARISPQVRGRTIGPGCFRSSPEKHESNGGSERNVELVALETKFAPDLKVTITNRASSDATKGGGGTPNSRKVDISDCRAVSFQMYHQELERKRLKEMKHEVDRRQARIREADRARDLQREERIKKAESDAARKAQESELKLLEAIREQERIAREFEEKRKAEIDEENRRLAEVSQQLKKKEEEVKKKHAMFDAIRLSQANFRKSTDVFTKTVMGIGKEYSAQLNTQKKTVQGLVKAFEQLLHNVNATREVTQQEVDKAAELCKSIEQTNAEIVEIINRIQKEIADRLQKEEQQKQEQQKAAHVTPVPSQDTTDTTQQKAIAQPTQSNQSDPLSAYASQESRAFYREIKTFYEQHQAAVKALQDDPSMKTYRFQCSKVITTPVNTISSLNFKDKFNQLDAFLSGQPAKTGDVAITIDAHPLGRTYCMMLLAKKLLGHADSMVSSNAPAAFPFAAIIVGLWQKYPEFGKFFLAYLHKECPYLVPFFLPQLEGQSQEDYLKSIGYRFTDNILEKQDQYLKRVTGFARLYAAVVVTSPRRGEAAPHPHGLECGWRWLCNILNLSPLPDICATVLTEFLQNAGPSLWATYGKQFVKVLRVMQEQYLPALNKVDEGGPKARLEGLIAKITTEGKIDRPEGMLSPDFW